ncbi:TRAP transporter large permease [Defluviitalea saccharophila]|uniref:TRAP transporter large permease n=1 Tax=Defluviitalea saccharophila TaxID=879970 RepID=A0ABZ2Y7P0_9FIRM
MLTVVIVFFALLILGMPVAFAIGISGATFFFTNDVPYSIVVQKVVSGTQSFTLLAIPLFIFAGNLMNHTGITSRMIKLSNVLVGHMHGHIGQVSIVMSTLMGGVSGSANADAAMESRILGPDMVKRGYSRGWGAAINGLSSLITATIPPSMGLIIYGSVGEVSIGRLFVAGIVPGFIMAIALMIAVDISAKKRNYMPERQERASLGEIVKAFVDCIWALLFPVILIVGIRFGLMTPSEAGAFAAFYAIIVGAFIHKELTLKTFIQTLKESVRDIGVIMLIVAISGIFGYGIVYDSVPQTLASLLIGITSSKTIMLLLIIVFLIIAGMFVETTVCALLLTPILLPIVTSVGVDPVHFGILMMTVVTGGIMTPPVGIALYTVSDIMGCTPEETVKEAIPFYIAILAVVLIIAFFPDLILLLPNLVYGN